MLEPSNLAASATAVGEPANRGHVAVQYRSAPDGVLVYRRDDEAAEQVRKPTEHWFCLDQRFARALTWEALAMTGPVAYVGEFVDRA